MADDIQKQLNDLEYIPRTYEEAVAERAQRRRDALESRRQDNITPQQAIVDRVTEQGDYKPQQGVGRRHEDHFDRTVKPSGAYYRNLSGTKQHSGAYFRRRKT